MKLPALSVGPQGHSSWTEVKVPDGPLTPKNVERITRKPKEETPWHGGANPADGIGAVMLTVMRGEVQVESGGEQIRVFTVGQSFVCQDVTKTGEGAHQTGHRVTYGLSGGELQVMRFDAGFPVESNSEI